MRKLLTRRMFLKLATAGAGLAVIESTLSPIMRADELIKAGKSVSRTTGLARRAVPSTCLMCPARCGIVAYLEENALVKIEGNPRDPNGRGRLCAKGQAGVNIVYNPDRLLYPIRRKGPRGSNEWLRISWDEALDELASRLTQLQAANRPNDLAYFGGMFEGTGGVPGRFLRAFGASKVFDEAAQYTGNKLAAHRMTWGAGIGAADLARSRFILNFGANPAESDPMFLPVVQRLVDAQMAGAKLVTFDPRLSQTAARSAEWYPIRPGADAMVALAMANVILQRGLHQPSFVHRWLNYPLEDLARHLGQYTPEVAEHSSGVRSEDIERLAIEFGTQKPGVAISGGGSSQQTNGTSSERAVMLLNALIGNIDSPGGYYQPRQYQLGEPAPVPDSVALTNSSIPQFFQALAQQSEQAAVVLTNMANPVFTAPNGEQIANVLRDETLVPHFIAFDSFLTETSVLADMVLPAATYLESSDVQSPVAMDMIPFLTISQPIIKPLGESLPVPDAIIELGKRMGGNVGKYFAFGNIDSYLTAAVSKVDGLDKAGGLDYLKRFGTYINPGASRIDHLYDGPGFNTPSGRMEFRQKGLEAQGQGLPVPAETAAEGGLTLITFQFQVHSYGRTADAMWLAEVVHENPVWLHPERAAALGVKRGDLVKVESEAGRIVTKAWPTQSVHPDVLAIGMGVGRAVGSKIALAKRFKSDDPNTEHIWWEHEAGVHPYPLIPVAVDPVGGAPSWSVSRVTISKA